MNLITEQELQRVIGKNTYLSEWTRCINLILPDYQIDSKLRLSAWLAQTAHESGKFTRVTENLNYRWESLRRVFPKYFPDDNTAKRYAHQKEAIANRVYANRMGNGSEQSGDGWKYRGRGLIQLTGKNNYTLFANSIGYSLEETTQYLETFEGAVQSSCWFWDHNNLNPIADRGDMVTLTKRINGGTNGLEDRLNLYKISMSALED